MLAHRHSASLSHFHTIFNDFLPFFSQVRVREDLMLHITYPDGSTLLQVSLRVEARIGQSAISRNDRFGYLCAMPCLRSRHLRTCVRLCTPCAHTCVCVGGRGGYCGLPSTHASLPHSTFIPPTRPTGFRRHARVQEHGRHVECGGGRASHYSGLGFGGQDPPCARSVSCVCVCVCVGGGG